MKDPWYKDYFDKQPKVTKDVYDTKHWENQYYKKSNSSWGSAWSKQPKKFPFYEGENRGIRKKIIFQGLISVVILFTVYLMTSNDNNFSKTIKGGIEGFISGNDYQPVITKMVRMGLEAENVDWPILNELRGNENINDSKGSDLIKEEERQPDNSMKVDKETSENNTSKNNTSKDNDNAKDDKSSDNDKKVSTDSNQYTLPISGKVIKKYGWIIDQELGIKKFHEGIDIEGKLGTNVKSISKGKVVAIGNNNELGNYILIELQDDITVLYGQLGKAKVKEGDTVIEGQVISTIGASKEDQNNHLHLEMRRNGEGINPIEVLGLDGSKETN